MRDGIRFFCVKVGVRKSKVPPDFVHTNGRVPHVQRITGTLAGQRCVFVQDHGYVKGWLLSLYLLKTFHVAVRRYATGVVFTHVQLNEFTVGCNFRCSTVCLPYNNLHYFQSIQWHRPRLGHRCVVHPQPLERFCLCCWMQLSVFHRSFAHVYHIQSIRWHRSTLSHRCGKYPQPLERICLCCWMHISVFHRSFAPLDYIQSIQWYRSTLRHRCGKYSQPLERICLCCWMQLSVFPNYFLQSIRWHRSTLRHRCGI